MTPSPTFDLCTNLDDVQRVRDVLLLGRWHGRWLLLRDEHGWRLPSTRFEPSERLERTVRRGLYEQTGGLLAQGRMLGLLDDGSHHVPLYVCALYGVETPVRHAGQLVPCDIDVASRLLRDQAWMRSGVDVLGAAHALYGRLQRKSPVSLRDARWL